MAQSSEQERQRIQSFSPKGTWALLLVVTVGIVVGWGALFFLFLSHGPVN